MRRALGVAVLVVSLGALLLGIAVAVLLGPDGRATTGPHRVRTDAIAVVTDPHVISWAGATVTVVAEVPDQKPVFVGLANSVDVDDYLAQTARLEVSSYELPFQISTRRVSGSRSLPAAPTALDWWIAEDAGLGGAVTSFRLPDQTVSLAILAVGDSNLSGLTVTTSYDLPGGFGVAIGTAAISLGLGAVGWTMVRRRPFLRGGRADDLYVWVDEHGVEHEIDPEDLDDYEVVEDEPRSRT